MRSMIFHKVVKLLLMINVVCRCKGQLAVIYTSFPDVNRMPYLGLKDIRKLVLPAQKKSSNIK